METSAVQNLISKACRPGLDQISCIDQLGTFLLTNKLSEFLVTLADTSTVPAGESSILVKDLVSVPDRTVGVLGTNQSQLPDWIFPAQFCSHILRNVALSLRTLNEQDDKDDQGENDFSKISSSLIQRLTDIMPGFVGSCDTWWRYIVTNSGHTRAIYKLVDSNTLVHALSSTLPLCRDPAVIKTIFGDKITETTIFELLTLRGLSWCDHETTWCLVTYLALCNPHDTCPKLLVNTLSLWTDEVEVDQGGYQYLVMLSWVMCACLGNISLVQREHVKDLVTRRLMSGMTHWLEADRVKRQLGMSVATVILETLGGQAPEWGLEDDALLETMRSLTLETRSIEDLKFDVNLDAWDSSDHSQFTSRSKSSCKKVVDTKIVVKQLDSDDSEDSDDDDFPAYDMSDDTPFDKDEKPISYIRDVLDHMVDPESLQQEQCLKLIPYFATKRLQYEDESVIVELLNLTVHLQNKFDNIEWVTMRQDALKSVIVCAPITCAKFLTKKVFDREVTLDTKFTILDSLVAGGSQLRENSATSSLLGQFLDLCVTGLCDGGGGAYSRVKVTGLEMSLLTHTIMGVASLVQLGENTTSWHRQIRNCTELLLSVAACNNKRPIQAAVLHGISVIAAVVQPHMLTSDTSLTELLAQGAEWAANLGGELEESGVATSEILRFKHKEMLRVAMEQQLVLSTNIKMNIDTPELKIKRSKLF